MKRPLVSVIIPTYKRPGMLHRAIASVQGQTYTHVEILVVDDNNPESEERNETKRFMEKYKNTEQVTYIVKDHNEGAPATRNKGVERARGEYVAFLDDDDEFHPTKIEKQMAEIQKGFDVVVCGWELFFTDTSKREVILYKEFGLDQKSLLEKQLTGFKGISHTGTFLFQKKVFQEVGGFAEIAATQDYELILRSIGKGYKLGLVNEALQTTYIHSQDRITVSKKVITAREQLMKEKYKYFYAINRQQKRKSLAKDQLFLLINAFRFKDYRRIVTYGAKLFFKVDLLPGIMGENKEFKNATTKYI